MGVYIKDMEMPTKQVLAVINPDGLVEILNSDNILVEEFYAVPVPPHGRCIDADALIRELTLDDEDDNNGASLLMAIFLEVLKAAPTVIEAEEGET